MWLFYAAASSFFAGITSVLAKCGIRKTDSNVATAIRTVVVLIFSWLMVLITGTGREIYPSYYFDPRSQPTNSQNVQSVRISGEKSEKNSSCQCFTGQLKAGTVPRNCGRSAERALSNLWNIIIGFNFINRGAQYAVIESGTNQIFSRCVK